MDRAEVGPARLERGLDLLGRSACAPHSAHSRSMTGSRLFSSRSISPPRTPTTWVTGSPVACAAFRGRSTRSHFESASAAWRRSARRSSGGASCTAASGVGVAEPGAPTSRPCPAELRHNALSTWSLRLRSPSSGFAALARPCGVAGTSSVNSHVVHLRGPFRERLLKLRATRPCGWPRRAFWPSRPSRTSVSMAARGTRYRAARSVRRQVRVPLAERAERAPEVLLGALLVERAVDVRHVQRVDRRRQPLDSPSAARAGAPAGRCRSLSSPSACSPITTTMRGCTTAISSTTRAHALRRRQVGVAHRALHAQRPVDRQRVDAEALEALHQRAAAAPVEGDALLDLRRAAGANFSRKMSACGWPEPSTGIRLPRGQWSHSWRSCVSRLSSRIARSRYFSRISSSVAGISAEVDFDRPAHRLPPCCAASTLARACPARALGRLRLQELERLKVDQALALVQDVGVAQALEELLRAVEVAHPDLHRAESLRHVAVRAGARDDPVLGGEALRLLVEAATATRALNTSSTSMSSTTFSRCS